MDCYIPTEYERKIEAAFANADFRVEFRPYSQPSTELGIWQILHQSNGAIIATGATPERALARLAGMVQNMDDIRRKLPFQGRKAQA